MTNSANPALTYRKMIREVFWGFVPPAGTDETVEFKKWLTELYTEAKQNLFFEASPNGSDKMTLFVSGAGLLTYGDLDKALDVLDNIPVTRGNILRVAWVLKVMLPLPENLNPLNHTDDVRAWIQANSLNLRWIEAEGKFAFSG